MLLESHFGVPAAGAVLVALNVRLKPEELSSFVRHAGVGLLLCDEGVAETGRADADAASPALPLVVDSGAAGPYEQMLEEAQPLLRPLDDERGLLAINYTSGTTGTWAVTAAGGKQR